MRKLISILVLLCLVAGVFTAMPLTVNAADNIWNGDVAQGFAGGSGTEDDPFRITSAEEWEWFAQSVYNGTSYSGQYVELVSDIVFNDGDASEWLETAPEYSVTPAGQDGDSKNPFSGSFNGNGNTISGVYMYVDSHWGGGLFGCTDGASIKNLVLLNSCFIFETKGWAAAVAGENYNTLEVSNVYVADDVYVKSIGCGAIGGIVGGLESGSEVTVTDCVFAGTVAAETGTDGGEAGGIIGSATRKPITVSNCLFIGAVKGKNNDAGIVGGTGGASGTIDNCISAGDAYYSIAAKCDDTSAEYVTDCYYLGSRIVKDASYSNVQALEDISDIYGLNAAVCPEGFTAREKDVIVPDGVAGFDLPNSKYYDTVDETESGSGNTPEGGEPGGDTSEPDIVITSVEDWMTYMSGQTVTNKVVTVNAEELDFDGLNVKPVKDFSGIFDGQGVVFKNLNIVGDESTGGEAGLFGCLSGDTTFKNFAITDSTITADQWAGAVSCCGGGNIVAENIYVSRTVKIDVGDKNGTTNSYAGGLFGGFSGSVTECVISGCVFAGTIEADGRYNGGLLGSMHNCPELTITDSMVLGRVPNTQNYSCGFIGKCSDESRLTLSNCIYAGGAEDDYYYNRPFFFYAKNETGVATVTNCYTIAANSNGKVYDEVTYTDDNSGVTLLDSVVDLLGTNASVTVEGFVKRDGDVMLPEGVADFAPIWYDNEQTYTVKWMNGSIQLEVDHCKLGEIPTYDGETPTKADYKNFSYKFNGWTPEVAPVKGDVTYVAVFEMVENETKDDTETEAAPDTDAPDFSDTESDIESDVIDGTDTEENVDIETESEIESEIESKTESETESEPDSESEAETEPAEVEEKSFFGKIFDAIFNFFKGIFEGIAKIFGKKD